ncbi:hypothetical protein Trisim1_010362 [Trichoderma cf. simile WF8]
MSSSAAIFQLSPDIFLLILKYLALHDQFLLSHTCKEFRHSTYHDWNSEISQLSFSDRVGFWAGLAYTLPDYWACPKCCKLHPVNFADLPATLNRQQLVPCQADLSRGIGTEVYSIHHQHIQFALKLSRLGKHQQYLGALMKPYTDIRISLLNPLTDFYAAEPKIIKKQFILREEWNISNDTGITLPLFPENEAFHMPVCPHLGLTSSGLASSRMRKKWDAERLQLRQKITELEELTLFKEMTLVEDGIAFAFRFPGNWIYNSCLRCATDIGIIVSADERKVTVRAWHNFGVEGSPMDTNWRVHVADPLQAWATLGSYMSYTHGSVRTLWMEGISDGTKSKAQTGILGSRLH